MIGVWDAGGTLAASVAELPLSVRPADGPEGSIVVVSGEGDWGAAAHAAVDAGAVAVVVVEPVSVGGADAPVSVPVVVVRSRVDGEVDLAAPSSAIVAECSATDATADSAVRDTVGWARELSGGHLRLRTRAAGSGGSLALLETAAGVPVSLTVQLISGVPEGAVIRVTALGAERRQVVVDDVAMLLEVTTAIDGATALRTGRFESPGRVALRRALAALASGDRPADLADLAHDVDLAHRILDDSE
ncbi:MAG TPA: hypothetical protein VF479_09655 [Pseudolysinimonas sp.]